VFQAMLANATRICEAKFGTLWLCEGDLFRAVALHNAPPAYAKARRRELLLRPPPDTALGRAASTKQVVQIDDIGTHGYDPEWRAAIELGNYRLQRLDSGSMTWSKVGWERFLNSQSKKERWSGISGC
jgi:hypothetical protein